MLKEYTCILCPNGCDIEAEVEEVKIISTEGAACKKGIAYVEQEVIDPQRNIATTVLVEGGDLTQVSVRLTNTVPKNRIFDVMEEVKNKKLVAPIEVGEVIIKDLLGLNVDVIATKRIAKL